MSTAHREDRTLEDRVHRAALDGTAVENLDEYVRSQAPLLDADAITRVSARVRSRMSGLGDLDPLLADDEVSDVLVNGPGRVWVERAGRVTPTDVVLDADAVTRIVERVVGPLGLRADRRTPLVDARLPDGSRVHVAMPPLAVDGPYLTIRRFRTQVVPLGSFADAPVVDLLVAAVENRRNIVVIGGTGAGKTTLLNALCTHLTDGERIVTVEDAAELRLPGEHVVRLESRPSSPDGMEAVTIRELVRNALRMRPDRIVVGEVRGAEALDMLQALNTGHRGCLSTCHANGPRHALHRLATMALTAGVELPLRAVQDQIIGAIDLIVQVERGDDGGRRVTRVDQVVDPATADEPTQPLVLGGRLLDREPGTSWSVDR